MPLKSKWYAGGLHFECVQCGKCCSGPAEGVIWITKPEIALLAEHLKMAVGQLRREYLKRHGVRTSIIENADTKDCIFLRKVDGRKQCVVYPVRPNQCRAWPFWSDNLQSPNKWNATEKKCDGINRGRLYSFEEIEKIRKKKKWWMESR